MKFIFIFLLVAGLACPLRALEPEAGAEVPGPASAPAPVLKDLGSGRITFVEGASVKISGSSQPAKTGDPFAEKAELETGASPVTEVTFGDGSVMRLGEKTKVSYSAKERIVRVAQGTVLFHSPTGNGGITLQGEKATGQVAGSTAIATQDSSGNFSFLLLESSGAGSVSGGTAAPTTVGVGELTTLRSNSAEPPQVMEVQVEAVRDNSPLFQQIPSDLTSAEKIFGTADSQSDDIQNDLKLLSSLKDFELAQSDPEGVSLAMICGVGQDEMGAAKNILLRPVDTAAGQEEESSEGTVVAVGENSFPFDARQAEAEPLVAAVAPAGSGDGLAGTDTAAGGEGDLGATDTAAGGGGGADTQAPLAPVVTSPTPGLTTPI